MSVASRIFSILRSQARATSRAILDRARSGRPVASQGSAGASDDPASDTYERRAETEGTRAGTVTQGGTGTQGGTEPDLATYYANLEIPYGAGREEIEAAWKRQARRYHPDRFASDPEREAIATELLQGINHAYRELRRHVARVEGSSPMGS